MSENSKIQFRAKELAVMCFNTNTIYLYDLSAPLEEDDVEEKLISLGHKPSQCHWLISQSSIDVDDFRINEYSPKPQASA